MTGRLPLHILTGFLGSGKTTLLNRIVTHPAWKDSAVLINEIGEISIDHMLVDRIESGDALDIVVLKGGCTCCALRGDMVAALRELHARRAAGEIPDFARVILETTGLADPAPILYTLIADPALRHKFERGVIVATVDATHGVEQLQRHPEARKQIAMADRIVVTKTDLTDDFCIAALTAHSMSINQSAVFSHALHSATPDTLLHHDEEILPIMPRAYGSHKRDERAENSYDGDKSHYPVTHATFGALERDAQTQRRLTDGAFAELLCDVRSQLEQSRMQMKPEIDSEHSQMIASTAFVLDEPVQWSAFSVWLTMLLHAHGTKILRFKALLNIADWAGPVALHAVHHIVYPPRHLSQWPKGERLSRLVVIAQDLDTSSIAPSLRGFFRMHAQRTVMTHAG